METPITVVIVDDFIGTRWAFVPTCWYYRTPRGLTEMRWNALSVGEYRKTLMPVFTEWWEPVLNKGNPTEKLTKQNARR